MKWFDYISLCKALSWRFIATMTTICISYWVTGRVDIAMMIGGVEVIAKIIIYYMHERAWHFLVTKVLKQDITI